MSRTADLAAEFIAAVRAIRAEHVAQLRAAGVDLMDIRLGLVGVTRGRLANLHQLFESDDSGALAYVTPVRVDPFHPLSIESPRAASAVRVGDIVDIVAWHPAFPGKFALRVGAATALGLIEPQYLEPDPVRIHRGPLGWLRAGCQGLAPLSSTPADVYRLLTQCRAIVAEDREHAQALRTMLERPWPIPLITIAQQEASYAA